MKVTCEIYEYEFKRMFKDACRGDQFSDEAFTALYEMFDHNGLEWDGDVIALCCAYSEIDADEVDEHTIVVDYLSNGKVLVAG